ncbi:MAG TPA: DUF5666 domain-containing protein [Pseudacidobacterium sp.]|nr:DUF5666 domain-containing protein [Pseudacidobacterium sp.]
MRFARTVFALTISVSAAAVYAQAPSAARLIGTVTSVSGDTVTLKSDAGVLSTVTVSDSTRILRAEPGQKDLSSAAPIHVQDLAVGDRILVRATPGPSANTYTAQTIIAMKKSDIAQKQEQEREQWQHGVGGIVKSIDSAAGTIVVASGVRTITIHATPKTVVRRYAQDSVKFDDARVSTFDQIRPGDQLRARGERTPDGGELTADEIVAGTFRNIAATVVSVNAGMQSITVMDLATKKPVTIRFTPDSQLHRLDAQVAQIIAMRLKGGARQGAATEQTAGHPMAMNGQPQQHSGDLQQVIQRAPAIQITDLHKGDAVMIVATEGSPDSATAITLLAGVEPMLQASTKESQSLFSSSWSLGGGGEAAAASGQPQ